jgi:hypothetical protein
MSSAVIAELLSLPLAGLERHLKDHTNPPFEKSKLYSSKLDTKFVDESLRSSSFRLFMSKEIFDTIDSDIIAAVVNDPSRNPLAVSKHFSLVRSDCTEIVYPTGGFFKRHKDYLSCTSNIIEEFTLIICLPEVGDQTRREGLRPRHTVGGETLIYTNNTTHVSKATTTPGSALLFRKDLEHEGSKLKSGSKRIVTVNLWATPKVEPSVEQVVLLVKFHSPLEPAPKKRKTVEASLRDLATSASGKTYAISVAKVLSNFPDTFFAGHCRFGDAATTGPSTVSASSPSSLRIVEYKCDEETTHDMFSVIYKMLNSSRVTEEEVSKGAHLIDFFGFEPRQVLVDLSSADQAKASIAPQADKRSIIRSRFECEKLGWEFLNNTRVGVGRRGPEGMDPGINADRLAEADEDGKIPLRLCDFMWGQNGEGVLFIQNLGKALSIDQLLEGADLHEGSSSGGEPSSIQLEDPAQKIKLAVEYVELWTQELVNEIENNYEGDLDTDDDEILFNAMMLDDESDLRNAFVKVLHRVGFSGIPQHFTNIEDATDDEIHERVLAIFWGLCFRAFGHVGVGEDMLANLNRRSSKVEKGGNFEAQTETRNDTAAVDQTPPGDERGSRVLGDVIVAESEERTELLVEAVKQMGAQYARFDIHFAEGTVNGTGDGFVGAEQSTFQVALFCISFMACSFRFLTPRSLCLCLAFICNCMLAPFRAPKKTMTPLFCSIGDYRNILGIEAILNRSGAREGELIGEEDGSDSRFEVSGRFVDHMSKGDVAELLEKKNKLAYFTWENDNEIMKSSVGIIAPAKSARDYYRLDQQKKNNDLFYARAASDDHKKAMKLLDGEKQQYYHDLAAADLERFSKEVGEQERFLQSMEAIQLDFNLHGGTSKYKTEPWQFFNTRLKHFDLLLAFEDDSSSKDIITTYDPHPSNYFPKIVRILPCCDEDANTEINDDGSSFFHFDSQSKTSFTSQEAKRAKKRLAEMKFFDRVLEEVQKVSFLLPQEGAYEEAMFCNEQVYGRFTLMKISGLVKLE